MTWEDWTLQNFYMKNGKAIDRRVLGTALNPVVESMNGDGGQVSSLDPHWDFEPSADDNESYEIEAKTDW
jgi:hypothetical protein